jgi:hypothetical protein
MSHDQGCGLEAIGAAGDFSSRRKPGHMAAMSSVRYLSARLRLAPSERMTQ